MVPWRTPLAAAEDAAEQFGKDSPARAALAKEALGGLMVAQALTGAPSASPTWRTRGAGLFGGALVTVFGLFWLGTSTLLGGSLWSAWGETASVQGVVLQVNQSATRVNHATVCSVTFRFTADGQVHTVSSPVESNTQCSARVGQRVEVDYNPSDPTQASLASERATNGLLTWLFPLSGVVMLAIGSFLVVRGLLRVGAGLARLRSARAAGQAHPATQEDRDALQQAIWGAIAQASSVPGRAAVTIRSFPAPVLTVFGMTAPPVLAQPGVEPDAVPEPEEPPTAPAVVASSSTGTNPQAVTAASVPDPLGATAPAQWENYDPEPQRPAP